MEGELHTHNELMSSSILPLVSENRHPNDDHKIEAEMISSGGGAVEEQ